MPPRQGELPTKPELDLGASSTSQKEGRLSSIRKVTNRLVSTGKNALVTENTRWLFYNLVTAVFTIGLIVSVSIFTYGAFYFAYMPAQVLQLKGCRRFSSVCLRSMKKMLIFNSVPASPMLDHAVFQMQPCSLTRRTIGL